MGKVTLHIDGVSACYLKNGGWNIVFPCDGESHKVLFKYKRSGENSFSKAVPLFNRKIQILAPGTGTPREPYGNLFETILDLTSDDFHKEGVKFVTNPEIFKSVMTIQNTVLYVPETKNRMNIVYDKKNATAKLIKSETAALIAGDIDLSADQSVIMKVDGLSDFPIEFNEGDLLYFDNDCSGCTSFESDFHLYQKIFENSADNKIEFDLLSFGFPAAFDESEFVKSGDTKSLLERLLMGPPPAFCDGFYISKANDLPDFFDQTT